MDVLILYAQTRFWSMGEGCGAAIFSNLPAAIAARGHRVRMSLPAEEPARDTTVEMHRGVEMHRSPAPRSFIPDAHLPRFQRIRERAAVWAAYQRWAVGAAEPLARQRRPDLVLGMGVYEAPPAWRLARRLEVPNVTRVFGNYLSMHIDSMPRFFANFPEVIGMRTPAARIIVNDDGSNGRRVAARLRLPPERVVHLRNGVDFSRFHPGPPSEEVRRRLDLRAGQPLLMTSTRLAPEKRLDRAILALRDLVREIPDAVLALLGDGPERETLEALARELGVEHRVRFPGPVRQLEIADWLRTADIHLSLLDRTNAANPVFEAMACGRPVIALDAGTTREVVLDGVTGIVLPVDRVDRVGAAAAALLRDPERHRTMGAAARARIGELVMDMPARLAYEVDLLEAVVREHGGRA